MLAAGATPADPTFRSVPGRRGPRPLVMRGTRRPLVMLAAPADPTFRSVPGRRGPRPLVMRGPAGSWSCWPRDPTFRSGPAQRRLHVRPCRVCVGARL